MSEDYRPINTDNLANEISNDKAAQIIDAEDKPSNYGKKLTPEEEQIILYKDKDAKPLSRVSLNSDEKGVYKCKECGKPLYCSKSEADLKNKTDSADLKLNQLNFNNEIPGAVKYSEKADGLQMEIICANCGASLGYVFKDEYMAPKKSDE
ncbi:hypothetical protein MmiEs2_06140 [Methanimicrococcus stummii]|uniref:MsrB domain-containing protein n=1 Tax=Methanimicrococcus stummii TaxID=3028294 RepID=A0AA96ZX13_9EURY|nr:peptide-methionine (R)-S-oxide reductase [Methanimicrococcus sp. Es2]WNY28429.1 hypothetical protein MmiEs2_06140 [Methanimicrococcus sp. Es2]